MILGDLGEFGFIRRFAPQFSSHLPSGVEGIGNDCAVIPFQNHLSLLITTDLLIEDIHFIKSQIPFKDLGYKSLAVNLSDIAAMGGSPKYAFLSLGLPIDIPIKWMDAFFEGFHELASETGVLLLGGDTNRSEKVIINIVVVGLIETSKIKRRSDAIPGDIICCTGHLGNSGGGLKILMEGHQPNEEGQTLIREHFHPDPHVKEGIWLSSQQGVHAMMDISDGILSDLQRIMEESRVGAHLEIEHLPLSYELKQTAQLWGWSAENIALTGGEDYCLLVTIDPKSIQSIQEAFKSHFNKPLYSIGTITATPSLICTHHKKKFTPLSEGFDHFKR